MPHDGRLSNLKIIFAFTVINDPAVEHTFTSSNLPIVILNTNNQPIPDEPKIEAQMKDLQSVFASNKRVDDLQAEMRTNYRDLSGKLDNVIKILLDRK